MDLPANATLEHSAALAARLPAAVAALGPDGGGGVLRINAAALTEVDSSTIALLLQARRLAIAGGRGFQVTAAPAKLADLARLYGVEELLSLSGTRAGSA